MSINKKISMQQLMFLLLTLLFSLTLRYTPVFAAKEAKQAAWLSPLVALPVIILIIYIMKSLYKNYLNSNFSLMDITYIVLGNTLGRIILFIIMLYLIVLDSLYLRYYSERLSSTAFSNMNISLLNTAMILTIGYAFIKGFEVIAKMGEIIFPVILIIFLLTALGIFNYFHFNYLIPISRLDVKPLVKSSAGITGLWVYYTFIFFISDKVSDLKSIKKSGILTFVVLTAITMILLIMCVGTLSFHIIGRSSFPYLLSVQQIDLFNTIEKVDSFVISIWIASDFVIIFMFTLIVLNMMKSIFMLKDYKEHTNIMLVFIWIFALFLAENKFELEQFSRKVAVPLNIIFGAGLPILLFVVGKIRRKI